MKDITVKAGKDFEVHIPYKANPKAQAEWLLDDKELINDDRVNVKVIILAKNVFLFSLSEMRSSSRPWITSSLYSIAKLNEAMQASTSWS